MPRVTALLPVDGAASYVGERVRSVVTQMFDLLARHPDVGMLYGETEYYTADGDPKTVGAT